MTDSAGAADRFWEACVAYGDAVFDVHDQVAWQRDRRTEMYEGWRMTAPMADRLSRTLLALRLYALSLDDAAAGRPLGEGGLAEVTLARAVAERPWPYELFAGLDALTPDAPRAADVNTLRLLTYDEVGRGAHTLARLDAGIRTVTGRLTERYRNPGLTLREVRLVLGG
ncbi:hypothetical protein [Actinacidiphila alni]|uniref:hypothetical protein n=1 Tax=Actinacidiphila alni TaxID=380248 RepID=UPI0034555976